MTTSFPRARIPGPAAMQDELQIDEFKKSPWLTLLAEFDIPSQGTYSIGRNKYVDRKLPFVTSVDQIRKSTPKSKVKKIAVVV